MGRQDRTRRIRSPNTRGFPPNSEPIAVRLDVRGHPTEVTWRDRRHQVDAVAARRELRIDWSALAERVQRTYFSLVVGTRRMDVYQDEASGEWFLVSVEG